MTGAIEALYVYDSQNVVILQHTWRHRPSLTPQELLNTYQSCAAPRPPLIYLSHLSPPTLLFSIIHNNLTFLSPVTSEIEPLLVLEFLHRVVDVLEDYFGSPLIPTKIEGNYDIVAELLGEMCDDGLMFNTEPNGLRDVVLPPSLMKKLLGSMSLPRSASLDSFGQKAQTISTIPWRRANVKHTNNEMYLDIIESLHCTIAPSGRPLAARVNGTMAFTSKISGIPDMLLTLKTPSSRGMGGVGLEAPVFHPCVRLSRWKKRPGDLSFVPPDGKFILSSYEMDLLAGGDGAISQNFHLPITLTLMTLLGTNFTEFEARLSIPHSSPYFHSQATPSASPGFRMGGQSTGGALAGAFAANSTGTSNNPTMEEISVIIPLPPSVKTVLNVKASKGQFFHDMNDKNQILWKLPSLASGSLGPGSILTLKAEVVPKETSAEEDEDDEASNLDNSYNTPAPSKIKGGSSGSAQNDKLKPSLAAIASMPRSAQLNFTLRGALLSGLRVDSLQIVGGKGLGEGVKPYKGVKYITRAGDGFVEIRC